MNIPVKLGAFALVLGVAFAGTYAVGALAGPNGTAQAGHVSSGAEVGAGHEDAGHEEAGGHDAGPVPVSGPGGLGVSAEGYTLRQLRGVAAAGRPGEFVFQIIEATGTPLTRFRTSHDKRLHLIVVRRDLTGFQHLHPVMSADGTWRTPLTLGHAGQWRVFADFLPEGRDQQVILGLDVPVAGDYQPQPVPAPASTAAVGNYTVTVDGALRAGRTSRLILNLARGGTPVTELQPYLAAYGHLVALRAGDLGYLHVHPQGAPGDGVTPAGPAIEFDVQVPTAGTYRLFLDFKHDGVVRTIPFTATAA